LITLLLSFKSNAQTPGLRTWSPFSAKDQLNKSTFFLAEAQLRSQQFYNNFSYHEYKVGMGFNFPKNGSVFLAAGYRNRFRYRLNAIYPIN
jgi:tRNA splicing endonuclease